MAKAINKLSARAIEASNNKRRLGDGGGLWLNVATSGTKSWVFRWTPRGGKPREMGIGPYPEITLASARKVAADSRSIVAEGKDPKIVRDLGRVVPKTFAEVVPDFLNDKKSGWSNPKSLHQWNKSLTQDCRAIADRPISEINTHDVLKVLRPMWERIPETASRTRSRIEALLNYAKSQSLREGENPAAWKGHLEYSLPKRDKLDRGHHAAMPYEEVPQFIERLRHLDTLSARALEFCILTATRTKETLHAVWSEIDLEQALWTLPPERMLKNKREHRVPLSPRAIELLQPLLDLRTSEYVFPGMKPGRPLSLMSMEMLLRRMKIESATPHGFRSSFRDWAGDKTNFPREIAEASLSHVVGSTIEQAYRRSDALEKRRALLDAWSDYCSGVDNVNRVVHLYG